MLGIKQQFDGAMAQLTAPGAPFELAGSSESGHYYAQAPANLVEALSVARQYGDREFLLYEGERRSFNDLMDEADAIGAALQARGIRPGERVALAMRNYPEWMAIFIGVVAAGAVIVPVNSWGKPADIAYTVEDCGARLVFCDQQRYDGVAELFRGRGVEAIIARPARADDPNSLDALVADFRGRGPAAVGIDPEDLAMIMYTSGTSGKPKGAASTHRAICQALYNLEYAAAVAAMNNGELINAMVEKGFEPTSLLAVPLFHVSGCHAQFLTNLRGGRRIVMMYKWDVDKALEYIEKERITTVFAAPSMLLDLLEAPQFGQTDTRSLFSLGIGGAATPPKLSKLLYEKLPQNYSGTGWGMTETNAQGTSLTGEAFHLKSDSAGFPHPIVDIRICDEKGNILPPTDSGEIWVRSCTNIREYWHRPEVNAAEIRDGWLKTGDIGYLDGDGFLFLADRAKDMIIRGGENIFPIEIENQLLELEGIKEVAAIGLPNERLGEEVAVVVHLHPHTSLGMEQVVDYAKSKLAAYKVPTQVFFSEEPLPRNASNKILKAELKAKYVHPPKGSS
ncbi:MAG: acyl--CoA ligase [Pseudomonadales bacterium]|nr:acyl--CoA ligase [Pseudomonadales bacterium]MCP5192101.1 acyl--CoA ligase [Pseudomonadales bacterium]